VSRLEKDGKETVLAETFDGKKFFAPNDICVDAKGRIFFTDLNGSKETGKDDLPSGVYRIDAPGKVVRIIEGLGRPNGIAFSPDGKLLYVSDRGTQKLHRYRAKDDGGVEADGIAYDFSPDRGIDGMRLDVQGNIWAAAGEGKTTGLFVVSPDGKLLLHQPVPEFSTNLAFGGKDNKDLFFTASTSVFKFRTTIAGYVLPGRK
jgi:gluconolactonase